MIIDLRSDTVTHPTPEMKEFMWAANVGDDVFEEDPSVNELESFVATQFGMDAALFCPSGTMSNQIAIKVQTQPGDEIICDEGAHIHYYEGGGIAFNSGATTKPIIGDRGVFTADQVLESLRPANVHFPRPSLLSAENTCNRGGGKVFPLSDLKKIKEVCKENGLAFHLDGARLFNAIIASNGNPKDYGSLFTSISICLSKGLGAPVGSLLIGDRKLVEKGRRIRKVLGGGMRQAGYLAAAGLFALKNNISRLSQDHELANDLERILNNSPYVSSVVPVETNIVVFELTDKCETLGFIKHLEPYGILAFEVGKQRIRFVTHLDIPSESIGIIEKALNSYSPG